MVLPHHGSLAAQRGSIRQLLQSHNATALVPAARDRPAGPDESACLKRARCLKLCMGNEWTEMQLLLHAEELVFLSTANTAKVKVLDRIPIHEITAIQKKDVNAVSRTIVGSAVQANVHRSHHHHTSSSSPRAAGPLHGRLMTLGGSVSDMLHFRNPSRAGSSEHLPVPVAPSEHSDDTGRGGAGAPKSPDGHLEYCLALHTQLDGYNAGRSYLIKFVSDSTAVHSSADECAEWLKEISSARTSLSARQRLLENKFKQFQTACRDVYRAPLCRYSLSLSLARSLARARSLSLTLSLSLTSPSL